MPFDRSKYQASNFDAIKQEEVKQRQTAKTFSNNSNGRVGYYTIQDGKNWMRVLPAHNPGDPAYVAIRTAQLNCMVDEWADGEQTGRQVLKGKKIFIATQHCDAVREAGLPDPIEYYIQKVYEKAEDFQDAKDKKQFLEPIEGSGFGKNWKPGCIPQSTWVCYVLDSKREILRAELRTTWFSELQKRSLELAEEADKVSLDMFSSPDDGFPLIITKGKKTVKGSERVYYEVSAAKPKMGESWETFFENNKVTDAELQKLESIPSLKEVYVNSYTTRELELALDGLKNLEREHPEYDILGTPEFEELVQKIYALVPQPKKVEEDAVESAFQKEESGVVTPLKMKKYLREYIAENYPGHSLPELSKDDLQQWYQLAMEGDELPIENEASDNNDAPQEENESHESAKENETEYNPSEIKNTLKNMLGKK